MTSTTMVLAILDDMTEPTFSVFVIWVVSAIGYAPFFFPAVFAAAALGAAFFGAAFLAAFAACGAALVFVTSGTGAAAAAEGAIPFSFSTVRIRARSLRSVRTFLIPSIWP